MYLHGATILAMAVAGKESGLATGLGWVVA